MPRIEEPFMRLVRSVQRLRKTAADTLSHGQWTGAEEARELVGRVLALDEVLSEMQTISGPGTNFGEEDMV